MHYALISIEAANRVNNITCKLCISSSLDGDPLELTEGKTELGEEGDDCE